MIARKPERLYKIHLIFPRVSLQKEVGYAYYFVEGSSDLMTHGRHELLFRLGSFLGLLACLDHVVYHRTALDCYCNLVCNEFQHGDIVCGKLVLIVIVLKCH